LNNILIDLIRKAGIIVCLFCFSSPLFSQPSFQFNEKEQELYRQVLDLDLDQVFSELANPSRIEEHYILSLAQTVDLLIHEDDDRFKRYERQFDKRKALPDKTAVEQFLQAEVRIQWAFASLKFGHELDAALNLRQAFHIAEGCRRANPSFVSIQKTTGLLNIMIGAVPEKYNWVLALMGLKGSTEKGIEELNTLGESRESLANEARLLLGLCEGFVFQKPEKGLEHMLALKASSETRLVNFFAAALAVKNSQSELALNLLKSFDSDKVIETLPYSQYLLGEIHLHKAAYDNAIKSYERFLQHYHGVNYVKDAHFKIGLCFLLGGNPALAKDRFKRARESGKEIAEADVSAAHALDEGALPPIELSKVRYATDGGYYAEAEKILDNISPSDLKSKKDQVEYFYRRARLAHKRGKADAAVVYYKQTIDMSPVEDAWYFAPNAALQLGYIYLAGGRETEARNYFEKALSYAKHEYKNSIDSKARSALDQMDAR
jgi:tetratricopeptide (TPR) repeat protein